jgi:hypothetical protein
MIALRAQESRFTSLTLGHDFGHCKREDLKTCDDTVGWFIVEKVGSETIGLCVMSAETQAFGASDW